MERVRCPNPKCGRRILDIEEMPPGRTVLNSHNTLKNGKQKRYIHFTKEYMVFIAGVPAIVRVRFFCALVYAPYRARAPPLRS